MTQYRLDEVTRIVSGATPLTKKREYYENGQIPWITPKDLSGFKQKYIFCGERSITQEGYNSCSTSLLPEGSVLFSSRAPIGYIAIAGRELCTNQGFKSFICDEDILSNQYLYYYLKKNKDRIAALGNGSTFKEVSRKTLASYTIELPIIDEQRAIVKTLVSIDERFEDNCRILTSIEKLIEHYYSYYFEDKEKKYFSSKIGDVVSIISGGTPSTKNDNYWNNGVYYWYTPTDITNSDYFISYGSAKKITISGLTNSNAKLIEPGAVLMTSRATIGEAIISINEASTNQGMFALIPKDPSISSLQLLFWVKRNKNKFASIANGSTFKELYKKDFEKENINYNETSLTEFTLHTQALYEYYKSIIQENELINTLKCKILETNF